MIRNILILLIIFIGIWGTLKYTEPEAAPLECRITYLGETEISLEPIVPDGEITNVVSTFVFYETYEEMWEDFGEEIEGWSECFRDLENNIAYCTIWSVRPTFVDDEHTLTIGHEVEHGIWGPGYHEVVE